MHTAAVHHAPALPPQLGPVRVTGRLVEDARLVPTTGSPPHLFLWARIQPAHGLPYDCRADLGADVTDHMAAEALLPHMRAGAVVSAAAEALELRMDHGLAVLRLVNPHSVLLLQDRIPSTHPQEA